MVIKVQLARSFLNAGPKYLTMLVPTTNATRDEKKGRIFRKPLENVSHFTVSHCYHFTYLKFALPAPLLDQTETSRNPLIQSLVH